MLFFLGGFNPFKNQRATEEKPSRLVLEELWVRSMALSQ